MTGRGFRFVALAAALLTVAVFVSSAGAHRPTKRSAVHSAKRHPKRPAKRRSKPPAKPRSKPRSLCASSRVLLLGSYPAELSANLTRERLDPGQPTIVWGHDFYVGRLEGRRVILGIAGQNTDSTYAVTALALAHFPCISAVVFEGTAGGAAAVNGVGDVTVASRWTSDHGKTFKNVDRQTLA